MSGLIPQRPAGDAARSPSAEGDERRPSRGRRVLWGVALFVVFILGSAGGFALGFPAMVDRAGRGAVAQLEAKLGVRVTAEAVDWSLGGDVDVTGLTVRDQAAPPDEAPLLYAERVHVIGDVALFRQKVTLSAIQLESPIITVVRRGDGGDNVRALASRLRGLLGDDGAANPGSGGGGGALRYLERRVPLVKLAHAKVVIDAPMPELPLGLSIPPVVVLDNGDITLKTDAPEAPSEVSLDADFAETSLDPGFGLGVELAVALDGTPRVVGARFDRPVRFYLGKRVAGVKGFRWTPDGFVVNELQLSVPFDPKKTNGTIGAAATVARLEIAPEPREIVRRAVAELGHDAELPSVRELMAYVDKVVVVEPALVMRLAAGGHHSFEDLVPPMRWTEGGRPADPADLLVAASRSAAARLAPSRSSDPDDSIRARSSRAIASLERAADALAPRVVHALGGLPLKSIEVRDGHVALSSPLGPMTLESLSVEASAGPDGAKVEASAVVPEVTRRPARVTLRTPMGESAGGVEVDLELAGLPLKLLEDVLPKPLTAEGDGVLHDSVLHLAWAGEGRPWTASGTVQLRDAVLSHPDLAREPLRAVDFGVDFDVRVDPDAETLTLQGGRLRVRDVSVEIGAKVTHYRERPVIHLDLRLPETSVQAVVDAFPRAMMSRLDGLAVTGRLAWTVAVDLDTGDIPAMTIDSRPVGEGFAVRSMGRSVDFEQLRQAFSYGIRREDGSDGSRMSGPFTGRWVPLEEMSPYLEKAVTTTEDPFYKHPGFSTNAIKESIITNLERGSFVRGASTITQQLVKNLFLGPHKTVSRKLQELFIAWQMEQHLSKQEIMALYLNVIEFGPGIYGVGEAADRWFGKSPRDLTLLECIFLSSVIPNPRRYYESFFQQGKVSPRWRKYLEALLNVMVERGKITQEEADAQAPFDPVFRGSEALLPLGPGGVDLDPPLPKDDDGGDPGLVLPMVP